MSLKLNFIKYIKQSIVARINRTNTILKISNLTNKINRIIFTKRFRRPILKPNTLARFEKDPDNVINKHNENIDDLSSDINVLNDTLSELFTKQTIIQILRSNTEKIVNNLFNVIKDKIKGLRRTYMLDVQTIVEDFKTSDNIESITGAIIDTKQGLVSLQQPISPISSVTPEEGYVKVEVLNDIPFTTPPNYNDILNVTNQNDIRFIAVSNERIEVKYKITVTFDKRPINQVGISINNKVPLSTTVVVNGKEKASNYIMIKGVYLFSFKEVKNANSVEIYMTANNEDFMRNNQYVYSLNIIHINIRNSTHNLTGTIISKDLKFNSPVTDIALKVNDYLPPRTRIEYYIADSKYPNNWIRVKPSHSMFDKHEWIAIGKKLETNKVIEVTKRLTPLDNIGNSFLYNILEGIDDDEISDGKLSIPEKWTVDTKRSVIYMGIDDYIIDYDYLKVKGKSSIIQYRFASDSSGTYSDMILQIEKETHKVVDNRITLKYTPVDDDIIISDKSNVYPDFSVNGKTIDIQHILNGITVYVTYRAKISEIEKTDNKTIEIIKNSVKVRTSPSSDPIPLSSVVDILFDEKKIRILPNASVQLDITGQYYVLYISFDYYIKSTNKYKLYKTNVFYTNDTDIAILPFTDEEIAAGNVHIINGTIVSKRTEYTMKRGWSSIVTTQPFPSNEDNPNDKNSLTGKPSGAGIILKGYDKMRAYIKPMRYVSLHRLANVVSRFDHRSFTIDNDGRILINFNPDVLEEPTIDGDVVIGRTVEWAGKRVNKYIINRPKFEINIVMKPTKDNDDNKVDSIKYKIVIKRSPTSASPSVSKLEILGI